jgi:class 3 adenylate cyclase
MVAYVGGGFAWDYALRNLLPLGVDGIIVELLNNCNQSFTYEIEGPEAYFIGGGTLHEPKYNRMKAVRSLSFETQPDFKTTPGHCYYYMVSLDFFQYFMLIYRRFLTKQLFQQNIFPSSKFENRYHSGTPAKFAALVALTFVLVAVVFFIYDIFVHKRNEKLIASAAKSNAIVTSLFPDNIRERLIGQNDDTKATKSPYHLKSVLLDGVDGKALLQANGSGEKTMKPLADLFLDTTVMFADICGFTAWSSVREPSQVFLLLESVYGSFDKIAKRRRVFKVETVGDCYVAVTGLPEPRRDHAVIMSRFACDIMMNMQVLTKKLEVTLGPDTGELTLRIGIHSGPVIGGVLRGARSRFQLFGDTMNTASRIESTGEAGRIQLSEETAELIIKAGKPHWVERRHQVVIAKGKGAMQTYWLMLGLDRHSSDGRSERSSHGPSEIDFNFTPGSHLIDSSTECRKSRLIHWNVEQLSNLIKQIVAHRDTIKKTQSNAAICMNNTANDENSTYVMPLDEVQEIITLPDFDSVADCYKTDPATIELSDTVVDQLKMYVTWISSMYRCNPFHNFDHASHVLMSVIKLMSRIVAPSEVIEKRGGSRKKFNEAATLHDHTYGITSDPLTQFACALSALIHDIDHSGVPNAQLVAEKTEIALRYKERSVAEQNSFDLAWNALMEPKYSALRATIFTNPCERRRFRQLVINSVLATDLVDKDLKALRNARWEKAFHPPDETRDENPRDAVNRKATIVIEHLIQASDVSHTMQHWHVFRKWNQRLFEEMYAAYRAGRAAKDPSEFWYQGEIGFFDFYVIPLAKKLKDCGVFGVSCDEFLNYAQKNRDEWESRGHEIVAEMVEAVMAKELMNSEVMDVDNDDDDDEEEGLDVNLVNKSYCIVEV